VSLLFPKAGKKPRRKRKPLAARRKFKEFGANCTKTYRRRFTDYQVMCHAEACRQKRLADATPAELEMAAMLRRLGIPHEREKIILNGDRWVLLDFFVPSVNLAIELDGSHHRGQKEYDHGRGMWLARKHGIKTVRLWNVSVLNGQAEARVREMFGLDR
jgi:very-short-patch-repair endonuclease